jgi:hypothetical protein
MDLSAITSNPIVKTVLMKQLKKIIAENGVKLITIVPDETGELSFEVYTVEQVIVNKTEFDNLINSL